MKRIIFNLLAPGAMCLFLSCGNETDLATKLWAELDLAATPNTLTAKEKKAGWQLLFDGQTTKGWHGYNTPGQVPPDWVVENACLSSNTIGGGEEQDLITDAIYRNFAFTVEYKMTPGSNSGIIYHLVENPKYKFAYETGPEFQLHDDSNRPPERRSVGVQSHGANYGMYQPSSQPFKPAGEWNRLMLICKDNKVIHIVNGVELLRFEKYSDHWKFLRNDGKWEQFPDWGKTDEGHISLQNHGSKLWFRNIKIKEL